MIKSLRFIIPVALFVVIAGFLAAGLKLDPGLVPSPLVDKAAPAFTLPTLQAGQDTIGTDDMKGKVWLLNVWASWCAACYTEHPVLNELAVRDRLTIVGLNYKDKPDAAINWLAELGNPYQVVAVDADGRVGIEWGVYGVPETFVVDKRGVIRYKHIGPVTPADVTTRILPLVHELQTEST